MPSVIINRGPRVAPARVGCAACGIGGGPAGFIGFIYFPGRPARSRIRDPTPRHNARTAYTGPARSEIRASTSERVAVQTTPGYSAGTRYRTRSARSERLGIVGRL